MWKEFSLIFKNKTDSTEFTENTLVPETIKLQTERAKTILNFHFFTYRLPTGAIRIRIRMEAPEETRIQEFETWLRKTIKSLEKIQGFGQIQGITMEINDYPTAEEVEGYGGKHRWEEMMWYLTFGTFIFARFSSAATFPNASELYVMLHPLFNNSLKGYYEELVTYRGCCDMAENGIWEKRLFQLSDSIINAIHGVKENEVNTHGKKQI